jgi:hypothetical protein
MPAQTHLEIARDWAEANPQFAYQCSNFFHPETIRSLGFVVDGQGYVHLPGDAPSAPLKKQPTAMDALIHTIYGANPPKKSANLERSITIAHKDLLFEKVPLSEVKRLAGELFNGPIPYSTHDLAVSTALAFFKAPEHMRALQDCQIPARLRVNGWAMERKVIGPLALTFENVLYKVYKP